MIQEEYQKVLCKCGCGLEASKDKYFKKGHKTAMAPKACACGCEKIVKAGSTFIQGHNGFNLTDKQELKRRARISVVMKGKPCSDHRRKKLLKYFENPVSIEKNSKAISKYFAEDKRAKERVSKTSKLNWQNPKYVQKQMKARGVSPNKMELRFDKLLQKQFPNTFKYVGDGEVIIAGKCPDFININGKKQLIELFGDYWHRGENPQNRIDLFKKYGYDTLVIWENELKNLGRAIEKVEQFVNGGHYGEQL